MNILYLFLLLLAGTAPVPTARAQQQNQDFLACLQMCLVQPPPPPPTPMPIKQRASPPPPPNPPPPLVPAPVKVSKTTKGFPLGSCKMNGYPSLPYELKFERQNDTSICFRILEVERYSDVCSQYSIYSQCNNMIVDLKKIVFWFNHIDTCGLQYTVSRKHMNVFPWQASNGQRAGRYRFVSPTGKRSVGDINLFKWQPDNMTSGSIEVTIARTNTFKLEADGSMNNYILCLEYDRKNINLPACISNDEPRIRYSFYDPYKSLCTSGSILM